MKQLIQSKITAFIVWAAALTCVGFVPNARATDTDGALPSGNNADGIGVLTNLTTGTWNSGFGFEALNRDTDGSNNTATGVRALFNNTEGGRNTANGTMALFSNTTGELNVAVGVQALVFNSDGNGNTAVGTQALTHNATGSGNTGIGHLALFGNTTGSANTAIGDDALAINTGGFFNTAIGRAALQQSTGSNNTALGNGAGNGVTTASNVIAIGTLGANVSNTCFIGNIRGVTTANANAIPVLIDSAGQLGTLSSSRRFKDEIKPMDKASEAILALKPVTFHYKSDGTATPQFGLIAEEVAEVNPDLVVRGDKGAIYTVRYDAVNAMLLNEFLKEHRKNEEQEKTIAQLKSGMTALAATVKEQAAQIQKVSAQLEATKPATQVVNNP